MKTILIRNRMNIRIPIQNKSSARIISTFCLHLRISTKRVDHARRCNNSESNSNGYSCVTFIIYSIIATVRL